MEVHNPLDRNWNYYSYLFTAAGTTAKIDIVGMNTFSNYVFRTIALDNVVIAEAGMTK